jgi:hypothetical protein
LVSSVSQHAQIASSIRAELFTAAPPLLAAAIRPFCGFPLFPWRTIRATKYGSRLAGREGLRDLANLAWHSALLGADERIMK